MPTSRQMNQPPRFEPPEHLKIPPVVPPNYFGEWSLVCAVFGAMIPFAAILFGHTVYFFAAGVSFAIAGILLAYMGLRRTRKGYAVAGMFFSITVVVAAIAYSVWTLL